MFFCIRRLLVFYGADARKRGIKAVNIVLAALLALLCMTLWTNIAVIALHFVAAFLVLDGTAAFVRLFYRKRKKGRKYSICRKLYRSGLIPVLAIGVIFCYGYFNMNHIHMVKYKVTTDKKAGAYRIALLTDIHYDTVQDTKVLKNKLKEINRQKPDIVVLGGDIVEEGTSKKKMQEVFRLLGSLENKYGVYYVYGNHDRQPYTRHRTFSDIELEQTIEQSGIQILEDRYVEIGNDLVLAGRADASLRTVSNRLSCEKILQGADRSKYIIVADHQPIEAEENAAQGVDLELSGHTHGGQIWPVGVLSELAGILNYGEYQQGSCKVIVSSGVAGWNYPLRTGGHCEYVIIDIKGDA